MIRSGLRISYVASHWHMFHPSWSISSVDDHALLWRRIWSQITNSTDSTFGAFGFQIIHLSHHFCQFGIIPNPPVGDPPECALLVLGFPPAHSQLTAS